MLVRESILQWLEAQLEALAADGIKGFRNLTSRPQPQDFPVITLFDGGETPSAETPETNRITMQVDFEVWVSAATEKLLGPAASAVLEKLSRRLFADTTAGGYAIDLRYAGIGDVQTDKTKNAPPMMGMLVNFEIDYWTADNDLTALG